MSKFKKVPIDLDVNDLTPLNISCTSTKCDDELHCFKTTVASLKKFGQPGVCKECGADLIEWRRIHHRDLTDIKYTVESLKQELFRHLYWHIPVDEEAINKAKKISREDQKLRVIKLLKSNLKKNNPWDGRQTPLQGKEIIHYAQHATATCCRKCLDYWHDIKSDVDLDNDQLEYCAELILFYIDEKLTNDQTS